MYVHSLMPVATLKYGWRKTLAIQALATTQREENMPLYLFAKSMALFWIFSEMVLLFLCRRGVLFIQGEDSKLKSFAVFWFVGFACLVLVAYGEPLFYPDPVTDSEYVSAHCFKVFLWNFFYTSWIILEGIIMMYAYLGLVIIRSALGHEKTPGEKVSLKGFYAGVVLFVVMPLTMYGLYLYNYFSILPQLDSTTFTNVTVLYLKICGFFWIAVEGCVAWIIYRIYSLAKEV